MSRIDQHQVVEQKRNGKRITIQIRDIRKQFVVNHAGVASIKTLIVWWRKRNVVKLDVLKGITLDVHEGECLALIGRNGAGKSTLLSLIARIYKPTSGDIIVSGRVAPLLELGAGFHLDLTGIENIYFNGVILGLTRKEVQDRLPKIIEFSELGDAIGAPVRTYSSGMMARLGFAIAIHVDADILIVDEVLAVGDQKFEYIVGEEGSGAFVGGLRYGEGTIYYKNGAKKHIYWQGPSVGFDFGGNGSRTLTLVYNSQSPEDLYDRFAGVEGTAYLVGGVGVNFQKKDNITLAPIRTGVGARLGANIGYLKYSPRATWNPF